jgi:hypothetical protein
MGSCDEEACSCVEGPRGRADLGDQCLGSRETHHVRGFEFTLISLLPLLVVMAYSFSFRFFFLLFYIYLFFSSFFSARTWIHIK